jgi:hypothetical protein
MHKKLSLPFRFNNSAHAIRHFPHLLSIAKNIKIKIYRTIILTVVLNGCETWSLTLREECRVRVFKNRVLRRYLGLRRRG